MKCHYEVLDLERDASAETIKSAYRKAALKYHPDKNLDDPEAAKSKFQLVQQAYEVLSDPQERAWYDRHREQIIHGSGSDFEDNSLDVYQYFTATCYKGFGDDDEGFYTVFRHAFEQLASEEVEYLDSEREFEAIPKFGHSKSDYDDEVHPFYSYWQSFCTKKSYAWLSTHNINEIRDRRILKVVEKDNKKIQQKARKERNEEIRSLVSFVRKRDKRVQAQRKILEERAAENRKRQAQLDLQLVLKRKEELAEQMKIQSSFLDDGYEEQLRQLEKALKASDDEEDDFVEDLNMGMQDIHIELSELNGDQLDCDEFFCVACNKTFKNQSSYKNHESSKKHKENVELIKSEMLQQDDHLKSEEEGESALEAVNVDEAVGEAKDVQDEEGDGLVSEEDIVIKSSSSKKKNKKQKNIASSGKTAQDFDDEEASNMFLNHLDSDDDDWRGKTQKSKAKTATKKESKSKKSKSNPVEPTTEVAEEDPTKIDLSESVGEKPFSADTKCVTCKEDFSSKNKLFSHLKKTNHGVYIPKGKVVTENDIPELRKGKSKRRN